MYLEYVNNSDIVYWNVEPHNLFDCSWGKITLQGLYSSNMSSSKLKISIKWNNDGSSQSKLLWQTVPEYVFPAGG